MIGQQVSHYRIVRRLGAGGMGVVYEAEDLELDRHVALKFLPEELSEDADALNRFRREARVASALNHPHICSILEIGEHAGQPYLILELLKGETLTDRIARGHLETTEVIRLGVQLADALDAAHTAGIIHRDIKPANLFINERGDLKVLDFGLAKRQVVTGADSDTSAPTMRASDGPLTTPGTTMGTVNYMSPEQVRAEELDARTDLFSAGVVLYEMATGKQPFTGSSVGVIFSEILNAQPAPASQVNPDVTPELQAVVDRLLDKDLGTRYQTAQGALEDLAAISHGSGSQSPFSSVPAEAPTQLIGPTSSQTDSVDTFAATPIRRRRTQAAIVALAILVAATAWMIWRLPTTTQKTSTREASTDRQVIVVLPFENLGATEDDYFSQGVADEISNRIGSIPGLAVISRNSARRYAGTEKTVRQIGEELGVTHLVGGSVRWARGNDGSSRVRITPELIRIADDTQLWSSAIEREIEDIFAIQAEIAEQVASGLGVELGSTLKARLEVRPTEDTEAYGAYLRGQQLMQTDGYEPETRRHAEDMFKRAVERDPDFSLAWIGLARTQALSYYFNDYPEEARAEILEQIRSAADRAERLAPEDPRSPLARGYFLYWCLKEFEQAARIFETASAALPNDAEVAYTLALINRRLGKWEESLAAFERSGELDPTNSLAIAEHAYTLWAIHDFEGAIQRLDLSQELAPFDGFLQQRGGLTLAATGSLEQARAFFDQDPDTPPRASRNLLMLERDWKGLLDVSENLEPHDWPFFRAVDSAYLGIALSNLGEEARARSAFEASRQELEELMIDDPGVFVRQVYGWVSAMLGDQEVAFQLADEMVSDNPDDHYFGPRYLGVKAQLYVLGGANDRAIDVLEEALHTPYSFPGGVSTLRLDPIWDALREEPRFQALLEDHTHPLIDRR